MRPPRLTLSTGPGELTPGARRALLRPLVHHADPWFRLFFRDLVAKLRRVVGTALPPLILQGEAVLALEAAAAALAAPGDRVLALASGFYGEWLAGLLGRHTDKVTLLRAPLDRVPAPEAVAAALRAHPDTALVSLVHVETPSGTALPLAEIARVVRRHSDASILVDAVASFAGMPLAIDEWGLDLVVLGAQKCLGAAPGVTPVAVSARAWAKIEANPAAPRATAMSLADWRDSHEPTRPLPFTPSILDLYALDGALDDLLAETVPAAIRRHAEVAAATRAAMAGLGLGFWPASAAIMADTVTALAMPDGIDERPLRRHLREAHGIQVAGGEGELAGRLLRIGHMGEGARMAHVPVMAEALRRVLELARAQPSSFSSASSPSR